MSEYEMKLVIEELLRTIAKLKSENGSKDFQIACLKDDIESLRQEVARLEMVAGNDVAKAS